MAEIFHDLAHREFAMSSWTCLVFVCVREKESEGSECVVISRRDAMPGSQLGLERENEVWMKSVVYLLLLCVCVCVCACVCSCVCARGCLRVRR
jgi:hypothetical protein